jgi:hypothetical protein
VEVEAVEAYCHRHLASEAAVECRVRQGSQASLEVVAVVEEVY